MNKKAFLSFLSLVLTAGGLQAADEVRDTLGILKSVSRTPASIISGQVSGVHVGSFDGSLDGVRSLNVRGINTLRGDSQPVWIVDGAVISSSAFDNRDLFFRSDYAGRSYTAPKNNMGWLNAYEIESVRVVKDISEAAAYGVLGANGVVIVTTRQATGGERNVHLNSNAGVDFLPRVGDAFRSAFFHNHDIGIDGKLGSNSYYKVNGFIRCNDGSVKRENDRSMGLALSFGTRANKIFKFGLNSFLNYDRASSAYGTNCIGGTSTMILSRYPSSFGVDSVNGWLEDYDDDSESMRSVNSVYLQLDFIPGLNFKLSGGLDYENRNRIVWFGDRTSFGHEMNGAAGVLNNSLLNFNSRGEVNFIRNIAVNHHVELNAAVDFLGYFNRTNAMCASGFDLPYLRGKGMSASTGSRRIRKFSRLYTDLGLSAGVKYNFKGMAGLEGSFRSDKNLKYGTAPLFSPSASAFVDIRKIFFPGSRAVSALKLIGGWGKAGRETDLPYEYLGYYLLSVPKIETQAEYYYNGLNVLKSREYNAGIYLSFLSERFSLGVKYYDKTTEDSFALMSGLKISGDLYFQAKEWTPVQEYCSTIGNRGLEFDARLGLIRTKTVRWTLNANLARNINRIASIDAQDVTDALITKGLYIAPQQEGASVSGNFIPKIHGGLDSSLEIDRFTLDFSLVGAYDFELINFNNILKAAENVLADNLFERGDYLRLDHVGASWNFRLRSKVVKELRLSASAHNLFTLTKYSGWNPDVNSYGICVRNAGADYGSYPLARTVVLGVNLKF